MPVAHAAPAQCHAMPCHASSRYAVQTLPLLNLTCLQRAPDKAESVELPQRRLSPLRPADSYAQMNEAMRVGGSSLIYLVQPCTLMTPGLSSMQLSSRQARYCSTALPSSPSSPCTHVAAPFQSMPAMCTAA